MWLRWYRQPRVHVVDMCSARKYTKRCPTAPDTDTICLFAYRWASAGAFYPFSRNHYTYFARPHEYYRWPDVAESAKKAYGLRYRLLTYIYSNLWLAHSRGGPVAKPVLFTDPADVKAR